MEAEVAADSLALAVSRLRRRAWRVHGGAAACAFVASAAAIAGLASLAMGLGAGPWVQDVAWAAVFGAAGLALIHASRRAGALTPASLARILEDKDPRAAGLATAVELAERLSSSAAADFSRELAWAHVSVAAGRAVWVGPEKAFPSLPFRRSLAVACAASAAFGLALWSSETVGRGLRLLAVGPSDAATVAPKATPITGDIALTYHYPRYTGLPQKTVEGTNGEISALRGTEVHLETRSDREVAKAYVEVGGASLPLEVEGGRRLSGNLQVQGSGTYSFRFEDERGRTLAVGPPIPIVAIEDGVPAISIEAPAGDLVLTETDAVDVGFDASDDFGVAAVELVFRVAGADEQRVPIASYGEPKPRASGQHRWELSTLGVKPGDTVTWYLRAKDNDAVGGGKWGQSRTLTIKIFSEAEHRRELIAKVQEAWEQLVIVLGDRVEPRAGPRKVEGEARIEAGARADEGLYQVATQLTDVAAQLSEDERAPEELLAAIHNLSRNLVTKGQTTRATRARARRSPQNRASLLAQLDRVEADEQREIEQGILYLEALLDRQRLLQIEELAQELAADRRELANLLEDYRDAPTDEAKDAIRRELSRLKARMAELMQQMAQLGKGLQDEHLNAEAMAALSKERDMMSQLDQVEKLLAEGKTDEALAELQKLGMQMDQMAQAFDEASRSQTENDPALQKLAEDMERYEQDLNELARDQEAVARATENLRRDQGKELRDKLARQGDAKFEELRRKIAEARAHLAKIPEPKVPQRVVDDLGGTKERLNDLENALLAKDFDAAQESAARALAHAHALELDLAQERQRLERFAAAAEGQRIGEMHQEAKEATPLVREVKEKLDELFAGTGKMNQQQREQAQRLAQRQEQLGRKMEELQEQAKAIGQQAPIFDEESQASMEGARRSMSDAEGKLRGNDPGGALASERSAQEQLKSLQRGLEEAKQRAQGQGGGGSGFPMPMASGGGRGRSGGKGSFDGKEKVAIPGADQYKAPEEFRKEILDAMKKGTPEGFQENVRDYYQEIVK